MSDCDEINSLAGKPGLVDHWKREFVANWVDDMRKDGYDKAPKLKTALDAYENEYHTRPISLGKDLAGAIETSDREKVDAALKTIESQPPVDKRESMCTAQEFNTDHRKEDSNLPQISLVFGKDEKVSLAVNKVIWTDNQKK